MKLSLILIFFIPALGISQELKLDSWEEWEEEMNFRYYDFGECLCPWMIKGDSSSTAKTWDQKNFSPYQWDNSKPIILKLDSVKDKELIKLLLDKPKFTLPKSKPEEKKKTTI